MRKQLTKVCVLSLTMAMLCGCQMTNTETESDNVQNTSSEDEAFEQELDSYMKGLYNFKDDTVFSIKNYKEYMPLATVSGVHNGTYAKIIPGDEYDFPQGGCTDGKFVYLAMSGNDKFRITKVDMSTWEIVDRSEPLFLGHANGMTYNSKTNQIIVANDTEDHYKEIFFMDPDSLTVTGEKTLAMDIATIAYNATRDQYVVADNDEQFYVLDADFNELLYNEGHYVNLSPQDCDCDENYIYIGNTGVSKDPGMEATKVYSWDGEYQGIFRMEIQEEHESIFNYDGKYYVAFVIGNGCGIYEIHYDFEWLAE